MAKRKSKSKRSLTSLPKGLPLQKNNKRRKKNHDDATIINPFDMTIHRKKPKFEVHNRFRNNHTTTTKQSKLAIAISKRQDDIKQFQKESKKSNTFIDRRIGEYNTTMKESERNLARLVRERSQRSKRSVKYNLEESNGDDDHLTHDGKSVLKVNVKNHVLLSSDDEEDGGGNLDAIDTEMHFGGGNNHRDATTTTRNPYSSSTTTNTSLVDSYSNRKIELDEMIQRRKMMKAERILSKESQVERFDAMDDEFDVLSTMLQYRDKQAEIKAFEDAKRSKKLSKEDEEMQEWNLEMKSYLYQQQRRVKATDRTKTPEEIAQEEAERLHELETRRLARMNGEFLHEDDFSDIEDDDDDDNNKKKKKSKKNKKQSKKKKKNTTTRNPEALSDSEDEEDAGDDDDDDLEIRFTSDGLVYVDQNGKFVKKVADQKSKDQEDDETTSSDSESSSSGSDDSDDDADDDDKASSSSNHHDPTILLPVGTKVEGNYRVKEQYNEQESWYTGTIRQVHRKKDGKVTYDVDYDDGDFEEGMEPQNVRPVAKTKKEQKEGNKVEQEAHIMKRKRQKAKEKARKEMPYVFEVPTTLEALHDMIGTHAETGDDASLLITRIHTSNSVRLDRRNNTEKMQNFYDVLLRRFVAVGDALHRSGNGGPELKRYSQLDHLTKVLYQMSQDAPQSASAIWSRRLGIFQNAHAKRLRDAQLVFDDDDDMEMDPSERSAWPSIGTILLLRAMGHIFPVTDLRHSIVTPTLLLLGQYVAQTPVQTMYDLNMGILCCSLLLEYTAREAKRVVPEAMAFLTGTLSLFGTNVASYRSPVPSLEAAKEIPHFQSLRSILSSSSSGEEEKIHKLSLERDMMINKESSAVAILFCTLDLIERTATCFDGGILRNGESELFDEISKALLALLSSKKVPAAATNKKKKKNRPLQLLPKQITNKITKTAKVVSNLLQQQRTKIPLARRSGPSVADRAIKSLAPRMEDYSRYSMSKDKGKSAKQAALDRTRREYKREHKAVARELRMDASMVERQRMQDQSKRDAKAKAKRHANYAWLEGEQATMNQQVREGGGLLSGGGMGAARAKARSGKLGMKKGGKLSR